ncbi:SusC/RagA family TonB-linked outer membrane protein [Pedobacter faecalis]|uniref:SusC/RagA family TonB-linked outer membrane protein n=1 Tax=Pedobacter faecalis TaxID=3041495 RepID=UPI00254E3E70|nr:SusC/RagA family TonB-linked outer membrane protein [Pedobacter sp. ELA7]
MNFSTITNGHRMRGKRPVNKLFLAMKLTVLIVMVSFLHVAARGYSQITLNKRNASLPSIIESIEKQSGYVFLYNENQLQDQRISIQVKNATIDEVLTKCFTGTGISFQIINNNIALTKRRNADVTQQSYVIQGKVTDTTGASIPGVTISLAGTTFATTDGSGNYRIESRNAAGSLSVSMLGYITREIPFDFAGRPANQTINVILRQSTIGLKEVVINTGIYTRKAESFTGSTLVIKGEDLKKVGNANFFQALKNISPSMVLDNFTNGSNPNALPDIQLRGTSTFPLASDEVTGNLKGNYIKNPNEPLFILDGFESTAERIFDLDMNRIESVTILKDAASKALYGAKAANGVIVIETKKLTAGRARVSYNSSLDLELPDLTSYNLTNSTEKLEAERIDGYYVPLGSSSPETHVAGQQLYNFRRKQVLEGLDTYWLAKPLQSGVGHKHALSVELGGPSLNIIADVAYRDVTGAMIGSNRENISGNISTSYRVKNLLFRNIMSAIDNRAIESPYGTFSEYAQMNPYWRAENADGTIPYYAEVSSNGTQFVNPLYNSTINSKNSTDYFNFINNFYLEWTMIPGLRATTRLGIDVQNSNADEFYPAAHTRFENYFGDDILRKGSYQANTGKQQYLSGDFNLTYSKEINKHFLFGNAGFNVSERNSMEVVHFVEGFPNDRLDDITFGRNYRFESTPTGLNSVRRELGFLGSFSYMYDNRFLSDFTFRTNASSQFGSNKRWANFWSLGLGWNLHNEAFLKNMDVFKLFKVRGSLGSTGNSNFPTNSSVSTYKYYQNAYYQGFPGSYLANLSNVDLQWESKFDYNAGADITVGGLNVRFDYYQAFTENLIADITRPNSTGFNVVKENLGKVKNSGIELYTSYTLLSRGNNFLNLNFGLETNKNKIISLSSAMRSFNERMDKIAADRGNSVPVKRYEDGLSMNAIWAVPSLGIDPATGREIYLKKNGSTTYEWDAADQIVAGQSNPEYQGTMGFSGEYKGIGLNVVARYLGGGQLYNQTLVDRVENVVMDYNVDRRVLTGRWSVPGQNALYKRLGTYSIPTADGTSTTSARELTRSTTRFVQDRNEITISAVNLYYLFDNQFSKRMGIERLKVGFNMNELATFSTIGLERGTQYPFARTLSFNLSATF